MIRTVCAVLLAASGLNAVSAQETLLTQKAYAAGYKAAFTCSATFNAGKTLEQIAAHELTGIYTGYRAEFAKLPAAVIDRDTKRVSVAYDPAMPPRISQWRGITGCVQLPVGADASVVDGLPKVDTDYRSSHPAAYPWKKLAETNGPSGNAKLDAVLKAALSDPKYGKDALTSAVLVATPDALIAERYIDGFTIHTSQRTWSVAKSIAATLIGQAVQNGQLDVKAPANIAEWQHPVDPRKTITVENLLHMASGLDSNRAGNRTDRLYTGGGRVSDSATEHSLEAQPGARWKYANNDTLLAVCALRASFKTHQDYLNAPEALFHQLGMNSTRAETDWEGNFILSSQVWTTSRDLARLGILYLQDGMWEGERILPEGWANYVATPAPSQPALTRRNGSAIAGYGAQFWLFNERFPNIPNDTYAALGNRGQFLVIVPSRNLVIVRRGYDPAGGEGFKIDKFIEDVLAALE